MKNKVQDDQAKWEKSIRQHLMYELDQAMENKRQQSKKAKPLTRVEIFNVIVAVLADTANIGLRSLDHRNDDVDNLELIRVFNPITWVWESPKFLFQNLLYGAMGAYTNNDLTQLSNYVYGSLINAKEIRFVPDPYRGARYVMYDNGIFDLATKQLLDVKPNYPAYPVLGGGEVKIPIVKYTPLLDLDGKSVPLPEVGFTEKHKHHIDYVDYTNKTASFAGDPRPGEEDYRFTPIGWLMRTAGSMEQVNYLLEIMGAALIPNHQFNAFVEINGPSGSGKTTIINLIKSMYNNEETIQSDYTLDTLTESFPFRGNVNEMTNLVHITEINQASVPKNAIPLINQFANESVAMKQMGDTSIRLSPPPFLIMEGAGWARFDVTNTGVQRRILPVDLTDSRAKEYKAKIKKGVFHQKKFIENMNFLAINAFADLSGGDDHFIFQLEDLDTLPGFAQMWHTKAISAGDRYMNNFMARIAPALHSGYLPLQLIYELYQTSTELDGLDKNFQRKITSFSTAFVIYLRQYDFTVRQLDNDKKDQLQQHTEDELGIDFSEVAKSMILPEDAQAYDRSDFAKFKRPNWLKIAKKIEEV